MFKSILFLNLLTSLNFSPNLLICINNQFNNDNENPKSEIIDLKSVAEGASKWLLQKQLNDYNQGNRHYKINHFSNLSFVDKNRQSAAPQIINMTANPIGQPNIIYEDKQFNYMGHSVLKNNSNIEQIGSTPIYKKAIDNTVTSETTIGINFEASCDFEIFGSKVSSHFDSSSSNSETKQKSYEIPPQNIKIPPNSQITVNEYWSEVKMSQDVQLACDISGYVEQEAQFINVDSGVTFDVTIFKSFSDLFINQFDQSIYPDLPPEFSINKSKKTLHFIGNVECWSIGAGTTFNLDISKPEPLIIL